MAKEKRPNVIAFNGRERTCKTGLTILKSIVKTIPERRRGVKPPEIENPDMKSSKRNRERQLIKICRARYFIWKNGNR